MTAQSAAITGLSQFAAEICREQHSTGAGSQHTDSLGRRVHENLRARWSARSEALDRVCGYAVEPRGKMIRPLLLLESAMAAGATVEQVLPAAVGAESGHVASLIHDDIIDQDEVRRGRVSVQCAFGIDEAIVAGDALIFDLFASLAECQGRGVSESNIVRALRVVAHAGLDLCRGQSMESELSRTRSNDIDAYLNMITLKTGSFFKSACECGAVLAGADDEMVAALASVWRRAWAVIPDSRRSLAVPWDGYGKACE